MRFDISPALAILPLLAASAVAAGLGCSSGETGLTSTGSGGAAATTSAGSGGAASTTAAGTGGAETTSGTGGAAASSGTGGAAPATSPTVFLILMENHTWADIQGSDSATYIKSLLPKGAHAEQYYNPPKLHPSEPNYIWLEAGSNLGIVDDNPPSANHLATTKHLVTQIEAAGLTWKAYQEDISGTECPIAGVGKYAPKHNPMVFFDDVTDGNKASSQHCLSHERPFSELAPDLGSDKIAHYNFITPSLCHDMHDKCAPQNDAIKQGDDWLAALVPSLLASKAYADGATVMITWDEGENGSDGPIGMIALGKSVKPGFASMIHYTHSSTLRTVQEMFGLAPFLGDAANATDLADLFTALPKSTK